MRLAGLLHVPEAAMWRAMDWVAVTLAWGAMAAIAGRERWFGAVWAGALFALFHGRDGIGQSGQRDLWMAAMLLWAMAALLSSMRQPGKLRYAACSGFLIGSAVSIKPFAGLWLICFLFSPASRRKTVLTAGFGGFVIPMLAVALFLQGWHVLPAFRHVLTVDLPYYAGLADGSAWQLFLASNPPSIVEMIFLVVVCLVLHIWTRRAAPSPGRSQRTLLLSASVLFGLASFIVQGKGYSYQRYPYIAFLLLFAALLFIKSQDSQRRYARAAGVAGLTFGVLFCAPAYVRSAINAKWSTLVTQAMENALRDQAPFRQVALLDGAVQCIDAVTGCTNALLDLHLRQTTGTLYDEYLFPQTPSQWGTQYRGFRADSPLPAAVSSARSRFRSALEARLPDVLIVSSWLFLEGPGDYKKLQLWPWLGSLLQAKYVLVSEHRFPRSENGPMGFRVYVRQRAVGKQRSK